MKTNSIPAYVASLSPDARADAADGQWDEVMTDALYVACGAVTRAEMEEARSAASAAARQNKMEFPAAVATLAPLFARLAVEGNRGTPRWIAAMDAAGLPVDAARALAARADPADTTPGRALRRIRRAVAKAQCGA